MTKDSNDRMIEILSEMQDLKKQLNEIHLNNPSLSFDDEPDKYIAALNEILTGLISVRQLQKEFDCLNEDSKQ